MNRSSFNEQLSYQTNEHLNVFSEFKFLEGIIYHNFQIAIKSIKSHKKIMICGNGGSASDAQHFAAELVGRFKKNRKPISCISLNTDTSIITAISNDFGYKYTFSKQIEALANKGDALILISTSGNSENLIEAAKLALKKEVKIIALLGKDGGGIVKILKKPIIIKSNNTARIQEAHIFLLHLLADQIEKSLT